MANNALLFIRNKKEDAEIVRSILHDFEKISGQKVNLAKSTLFFNAKTNMEQKPMLSNIMGMRVVDKLENYLDIPLSVGKNKFNTFRYILDRFSSRIKGYSKRLLSYGGKEAFEGNSSIYSNLYFLYFPTTEGYY